MLPQGLLVLSELLRSACGQSQVTWCISTAEAQWDFHWSVLGHWEEEEEDEESEEEEEEEAAERSLHWWKVLQKGLIFHGCHRSMTEPGWKAWAALEQKKLRGAKIRRGRGNRSKERDSREEGNEKRDRNAEKYRAYAQECMCSAVSLEWISTEGLGESLCSDHILSLSRSISLSLSDCVQLWSTQASSSSKRHNACIQLLW